MNKTLKPGTWRAMLQGCSCELKWYGRKPQMHIDSECPMHGDKIRPYTLADIQRALNKQGNVQP